MNKKINFKVLLAFPVGVMALLLCYISIYFIHGEEYYINALKSFNDWKSLLLQIVFSGLLYVLVYGLILISMDCERITKFKVSHIVAFCLYILIMIAYVSIESILTKSIDDEVYALFVGTVTLGYCICVFSTIVKKLVDVIKINRKLNSK